MRGESSKARQVRRAAVGLALASVLLAETGCQTFGLSASDFEAQQRGGTADTETGEVVGVAGSVAAFAAVLGAAIASAVGK